MLSVSAVFCQEKSGSGIGFDRKQTTEAIGQLEMHIATEPNIIQVASVASVNSSNENVWVLAIFCFFFCVSQNSFGKLVIVDLTKSSEIWKLVQFAVVWHQIMHMDMSSEPETQKGVLMLRASDRARLLDKYKILPISPFEKHTNTEKRKSPCIFMKNDFCCDADSVSGCIQTDWQRQTMSQKGVKRDVMSIISWCDVNTPSEY